MEEQNSRNKPRHRAHQNRSDGNRADGGNRTDGGRADGGNRTGGSSSGDGKKNSGKRNQRKGTGNKSLGDGKNRSRGSRNRKKPSQPVRVENSQRYLQICKLFRHYKPFVVNGIPVGKIAEAVRSRESQHAHQGAISDPNSVSEKSKDSASSSPVTPDSNASTSSSPATKSSSPSPPPMNNHDKQKYLKQYLLEFMTRQPDAPIRISFSFSPSDPDFPFDLESLSVCFIVPTQFPYDEKDLPYIVVLNEDIPRGFALNLEDGFKRICRVSMQNKEDEEIVVESKKSLVGQIEALDKNLELFLKLEERPTVKIVRQKAQKKSRELTPEVKTEGAKPPKKDQKDQKDQTQKDQVQPEYMIQDPPRGPVPRGVSELRNSMITDLISRTGTQTKLFKRTAAEDRFKITLPVYQNALVPELWRKNRKLELMVSVPADYPESGLHFMFPNNFNTNLILKYKKDNEQLTLLEYTREYKQIERNFLTNTSRTQFGGNKDLVGRINWVANNVGVLAMPREEHERWQEGLAMMVQ